MRNVGLDVGRIAMRPNRDRELRVSAGTLRSGCVLHADEIRVERVLGTSSAGMVGFEASVLPTRNE